MDLSRHSYEELREVVVDILLKRVTVTFEPSQYRSLLGGIAEVLGKLEAPAQTQAYPPPRLHRADRELVRDIFWDLFRQGLITLGMNDDNEQWPFFRLSYFGERTLAAQSPFRFHDASSFLSLVRSEIPDVSAEALTYLDEAVAAFYAGCLFASCVMLGVAAEAEFLRLAEGAAASATHGPTFASVAKQRFIRQKITKFQDCLSSVISSLPQKATEDLDTNFGMIQSVLRIARNDAGHPTAVKVQREQVYIYLQLFIPFARQLMRLRGALA